MDDEDILKSARTLIEQYGEKAVEVATAQVVRFQKIEDGEGMTIWVAIIMAIFELTESEPDGDVPSKQ